MLIVQSEILLRKTKRWTILTHQTINIYKSSTYIMKYWKLIIYQMKYTYYL